MNSNLWQIDSSSSVVFFFDSNIYFTGQDSVLLLNTSEHFKGQFLNKSNTVKAPLVINHSQELVKKFNKTGISSLSSLLIPNSSSSQLQIFSPLLDLQKQSVLYSRSSLTKKHLKETKTCLLSLLSEPNANESNLFVDSNTLLSDRLCENAFEEAKNIYRLSTPLHYHKVLHKEQLNKAKLYLVQHSPSGQLQQKLLLALSDYCEKLWTTERQACSAVNVNGHYCENLQDLFTPEHQHSAYPLSFSCACGKSILPPQSFYDINSANTIRASSCCQEFTNNYKWTTSSRIKSVSDTETTIHFDGPEGNSYWSLVKLGHAKTYKPNVGILLTDTHYLLQDWYFFKENSESEANESSTSKADINWPLPKEALTSKSLQSRIIFGLMYENGALGATQIIYPLLNASSRRISVGSNKVQVSLESQNIQLFIKPSNEDSFLQLTHIFIVTCSGHFPVTFHPSIQFTLSEKETSKLHQFTFQPADTISVNPDSFYSFKLPTYYFTPAGTWMPFPSSKNSTRVSHPESKYDFRSAVILSPLLTVTFSPNVFLK